MRRFKSLWSAFLTRISGRPKLKTRLACQALGLLLLTYSAQAFSTSSDAGAHENEQQLVDPRNEQQWRQPSRSSSSEIEPFGSFLFQGRFAHQSFTGFNPDYQINVGDQVTVRLWGAVEFNESLTVDRQGNIFLPGVGPVAVINVRNSELQRVISHHVQKVFQRNVNIYTSLTSNQSVKIYVTGFVRNPGLYAGLNTDSVMYYLDKAGGIDPDKGSYVDIRILRGGDVIHTIDLYSFILDGKIAQVQFQDGDTILVGARRPTVRVSGLVQNQNEFELKSSHMTLKQVLNLARPQNLATHARLLQNLGMGKQFSYLALDQLDQQVLRQGDSIKVLSDQSLNNITVRIQGEHEGVQEVIFARGTRLSEVIETIQFSSLSDRNNIQLFRSSVQDTQKERLNQSLTLLERSILGANPASREEAELRAREAEMVLKLIERARKLEPTGQVVLARDKTRYDMVLESGDVIYIPQKTQVVMVHGEVLFPNAIAHHRGNSVRTYVNRAGGFTQRANRKHVVILHRDGSFSVESGGWFRSRVRVQAGDEIFVIPKVDTKTMQLTKDIAQILYQIAVTTRVVLTI